MVHRSELFCGISCLLFTVTNIILFNVYPVNVDLDAKNTAVNFWQEKSETLDFTEADRIPDGEFNKIIWYAVKGLDAEYPGTRRAAFLKVIEDED